MEMPIKSFGRWYITDLKDSQYLKQIRQDTISGLKKIDYTALLGKLKLWGEIMGEALQDTVRTGRVQ